ncbi:glycosyltransferase [Prevotella sp. E13-17]|uniref:glycosyltransferase family 2 protein n=1 Tax=Prevotella sp. E13-17 TaxID=2913616 RepID=UPI001EDB2927|nr:glycosyltransferase [Prevotella sp. E13-17]UKK50386.1 glycosyltransferase [Prevotella sp. E13-17]
MSNPKISIISPVYNVEKYICRCVDSIIAQTFTDWELILVDDGSPDTSGTICDQYASQDSRIRVIHKQNGGVSAARQTGLDASQGEYVIHADPDDWVEPTMLEELYANAKAEDADIVICDYYTNSGDRQVYIKQEPKSLDHDLLLHNLFGGLHGSCCNKLVRRNRFMEYNIKFPFGINYCEDRFVIISLYCHNIKTAYLPEAFYHYYSNPDSITRRYSRKQYEEQQAFLNSIEKILPDREFKHLIQKERFESFLDGFIYNVLSEEEVKRASKQFSSLAYARLGLRWRIGFVFLQLGLYNLAHKFIRY